MKISREEGEEKNMRIRIDGEEGDRTGHGILLLGLLDIRRCKMP